MQKLWTDDAWDDYLLKYDLTGWWSRHIDETHRLIYCIEYDKIKISHCRTHYEDK